MRMTVSKEDLIIIRECMYSVTIKGKDARLFGLLLDRVETNLERLINEETHDKIFIPEK
jgi:hypothetical protein